MLHFFLLFFPFFMTDMKLVAHICFHSLLVLYQTDKLDSSNIIDCHAMPCHAILYLISYHIMSSLLHYHHHHRRRRLIVCRARSCRRYIYICVTVFTDYCMANITIPRYSVL